MTLLDLLFPRKCLGCGRTGSYFCSGCLNFVSLTDQSICPVCEKPSVSGFAHPLCRQNNALDGLTSIFSYKGVIAKAISKLKYRYVSDIADELTEIFVSLCGEDQGFTGYLQRKNVVIVPVPLHPRREKWRGFSQTELLGELIADKLRVKSTPDLLVRIKDTKSQVDLKERERKANVRGAFAISPNNSLLGFTQGKQLKAHNLLLFDDVWTSGSTLKEAGKVLKKEGFQTVWGLTLAR